MQRRSFLKSATLAGAAGGVSLSMTKTVLAAPAPARFRLLREDARMPGRYLPLDAASCADCAADALRVTVQGLVRARTSRLRALRVEALYDLPMQRAPFIAWQWSAAVPGGGAAASSFLAGRATLRALRVVSRHEGDAACQSDDCAFTRLEAPLLAPGRYVLVADGSHGGWRADAGADTPLGARWDHLLLHIEAQA